MLVIIYIDEEQAAILAKRQYQSVNSLISPFFCLLCPLCPLCHPNEVM